MRVLFDVNYFTEEDEPVVKSFYKTEDGWDVDEERGFEPYIYALSNGDVGELVSELEQLDDVVSTSVGERVDVGGPVEVVRVVTTHPRKVPDLRDAVRDLPSCLDIREADIPFHRRFMIDRQLEPMLDVELLDPVVAAIDIEVYLPQGNIDVRRDPVTMLSYADNRGNERLVCLRTDSLVDDERVVYVETEKELLETLAKWIVENDVAIIVGYNTDGFDFPYLRERADINKTTLALGVDGSNVRLRQAGMNKEAQIRGRQHIDLYPVCRKLFNIPRYRLEDVYEEVKGCEKKDLSLAQMNEYWETSDPDKFRELIEYSISDVVACIEISEAVLGLQYELSRIVGQSVSEVSRMGSGMRVEYLLMRRAYRENILVPNVPRGSQMSERMDRPVKGAFVVDPHKGIHDNLLLFDFRSLYPSIIISHNVDPATLDCKCCLGEQAFESPSGSRYCRRKKGFIPTVLRDIIEKRVEIKGRLKVEEDDFQKKILDVQQQALKILANSAYGYYGFARARWYCRECAASITGWGRKYIHETIEFAGEKGFIVVYGDTDSVYLKYPGEVEEDEIMRRSMDFRDEVNKKLPEAMELEFEGFYPRGVFVTKKRYALMDPEGKLSVKGLETRRRDWADIAKKTQETVLNTILRDNDPEKAANLVREVVDELKSGKVGLDRLTIHTQLTRKIGEYVSEGPHVIAAKKAMEKGMDFGEGSIVSYIVTSRRGDRIGDKAEIIDYVKEGDYDPDYYINNQLMPAVMRVLEALGYTEDELKGLGKQMSLSDW